MVCNFKNSPKCNCYGFSEIVEISKTPKSGQNWHFYLSTKQPITLETFIKSLEEFQKIQR